MSDALPPVLHLIDSLAIGGAERMAVNLCNVLASQGHQVHLCATRAGGPLQSFISPEVAFLMLGRRSALDLGAIRRLVAYIRVHRIKVVHAHSSSFFLAAIIKPLTGVKIVWHDHFGGSENLSTRPSSVLRICSVGFSWIFSVNERLIVWAREKLLLSYERVSFLPNFPALVRDSIGHLGLPGLKEFRIVCAARLNPQKDHHTLVRAMQSVRAAVPQASLLLVGFVPDDAYARSVKALIAELGLADCVHLLGPRTDMAEILFQSAIGVLSSASEGLPVALLEYGLCGLPVVCTAVGECPSVLRHGEFGHVVPPGRPDVLSKALIDLLQDPTKQQAFGAAFQGHVNENYSGPAICKSISKIYKKVLCD